MEAFHLDIQRIDPFSFGFFMDESLEIAERVGLALREGAKHAPISFGKHIMPTAYAAMPDGGAAFQFSTGLTYRHDLTESLVEKYPEQADFIREYDLKFRP